MFLDLVDSTPLSERLDPEALREVTRAYQEQVATRVENRGGNVAQYLGDGMLVYFGFPRAHEEDARAAVLAGLEVLAGQRELNSRLQQSFGVELQQRIGIHTGQVVMGDVGVGDRQERLAIGMAVNVAARLGDSAEPDTLLISEATRRLTDPHFECQTLGAVSLKGVSEPVVTHRVLREKEAVPGLEAVPRLIGRAAELALLLERFQRARGGEPQLVILSGEAGIGKTRLAHALREELGSEDHSWLEARGSHFRGASALFPIIRLIDKELGLSGLANDPERIARLEERLAPAMEAGDGAIALLAELFSIEVPERLALPAYSPQRMRSETIRALCRILLNMAQLRPVVLVMEDLHWADPSTLELLQHLVERGGRARLLLLFSCRPGLDLSWRSGAEATRLELAHLSRSELTALVGLHTGGRALPHEVLEHIVSKADGVPLFAEELTKMIVESDLLERHGDRYEELRSVAGLGIPSTLQGSLMARLDRLPQGKPVAQVAASIGRSFSLEIMERVAELDPDALRIGLEQLSRADLVNPADREGVFSFRHALIQDVAYGSMLRRQRVRVHQRIADVLEKSYPELCLSQPEVVARHYTEAGRFAQATAFWEQAGDRASEHSSAREAVQHYRHALEQLLSQPASEARDAEELRLRLSVGNVCITTRGYASDEVERQFRRATDLCHKAEGVPPRFAAVNGLWGYHLVRGVPQPTNALVARMEARARASGSRGQLLLARHASGTTAFYSGEFAQALPHLRDAAALFEKEVEERGEMRGRHTATSAAMYLGWCLHLMGRPEQGLAEQMRGLARAERSGDSYVHVEAMTHVVALLHDRREPERTLEISDRIIGISEELGFPFWLAIGKSARGWARCHLGEVESGIQEIEKGLALFRLTGARVPLVYRTSYLVEAQLLAGRSREGIATIDEALKAARTRFDHFYDAEMLRLRGELLLQDGALDEEVAQLFEEAAGLARRQGARLLELRATVGLARLAGQAGGTGRPSAVRERLATLLESFTEGFDTPDLREAQRALA